MKRFPLILAVFLQLSTLNAQTAKDRAALYTQIDSSLPSNSSGAITAATLRTVFKDTIASAYNSASDGSPTQIQSGATLTVMSGATLTVATGGTLTAPAYHLPTYSADTISPSQSGLGWADGRVTLQTPVGALQFYETGTPLTPVIYWPGKIVVGSMESTSITGTVDAALISSTGLTVIHDDIMRNSLNYPLRNWANGETYAGASGIPYVADAQGPSGGSNEATDGVYFPQTVVTSMATATSIMAGRYRTATQVRADLAVPEVVAAPATATSTGTAGQIAFDSSFFYICTATNTWVRAALATW